MAFEDWDFPSSTPPRGRGAAGDPRGEHAMPFQPIPPSTPPPVPSAAPQHDAYGTAGGFQTQGGSHQPPPPPKRRSAIGSFFKVILTLTVLLVVTIGLMAVGLYYLGGERGAMLGDRIGELRIEGVISQGPEKNFWIESLQTMADNPGIKAILLRIDSPGGTVGASQEIHDQILEIRRKTGKRVYATMGDMAASGGYYIASAADKIFAIRGTMTGSIGVIMTIPQAGKLADKVGYNVAVVKSGRFKDSGSMFREMQPEERQTFEFLINDTYDQFVGDILAQRTPAIEAAMKKFDRWDAFQFTRPVNLSADSFLRQIADGRVYSGAQAFDLGLVDALGSERDALLELSEISGIEGTPRVQQMEPRRSFREMLGVSVSGLLPTMHPALQYRLMMP